MEAMQPLCEREEERESVQWSMPEATPELTNQTPKHPWVERHTEQHGTLSDGGAVTLHTYIHVITRMLTPLQF